MAGAIISIYFRYSSNRKNEKPTIFCCCSEPNDVAFFLWNVQLKSTNFGLVVYKPLNINTMSLTLRTSLGCTEAIIADDAGLKQFYHVANVLSQDFKVKFSNKEDDFDTINWEFRFKGHHMTLHCK